MTYSYDYYKTNTFTWPLIVCIITAVICTISIVQIVKNFKKTSGSQKAIKPVITLMLIVVLIVNAFHLSLGYKILLDDENNTETISGTISSLNEIKYSPTFKLDEGNSKAYNVYIDGKQYKIMSARGLSNGLNVEITYLKNSKFITRIDII